MKDKKVVEVWGVSGKLYCGNQSENKISKNISAEWKEKSVVKLKISGLKKNKKYYVRLRYIGSVSEGENPEAGKGNYFGKKKI